MGRADERRARQHRGGRRAAPKRSSRDASTEAGTGAETGAEGGIATATAPVTGGRAANRAAARGKSAKNGKEGKSFLRRLFTWKKILGAFFGFLLLGMGAFVVLYLMIDVPAGNAAAVQQSNVYKYSDGNVLARTGTVNREIVDLSRGAQEGPA